MSKVSEEMRKEFGENDALRDKGLTTPEDIQRFNDIPYGKDPLWECLDLYRLKEKSGRLPVIMIVHGGGWVYGTKETYQFYGMNLAQRGFAVVNATYRLAPEAKFPAQLEDICLTAEWIQKNAEQYGLDTDNVFAVGDSAGGHLLGLFCSLLTDADYASHFTFKVPEGFRLKAVGMNCGAYKMFGMDETTGIDKDRELMEDLLPEHGSSAEQALMNVTDHVNADFPPAFIMSCKGDFLLKQLPLLKQAYDLAGAESETVVYGTDEEPLYHVFHVNIREAQAKICNDDECAFFMAHSTGRK